MAIYKRNWEAKLNFWPPQPSFYLFLLFILCWTFDFREATRNYFCSLLSSRLDIAINLTILSLGLMTFGMTKPSYIYVPPNNASGLTAQGLGAKIVLFVCDFVKCERWPAEKPPVWRQSDACRPRPLVFLMPTTASFWRCFIKLSLKLRSVSSLLGMYYCYSTFRPCNECTYFSHVQ